MILTTCYDPVTTCQIFPWHHAAGDFVVRTEGYRAAVRLITARDYTPMVGVDEQPLDERGMMDALVSFLIQLSIRMRLDRLDGVSDVAWAPGACLAPMMEGFFQGLDLTARLSGFPETFPLLFRGYWNHLHLEALMENALLITDAQYDSHTEERRVIKSHLDDHMRALASLLTG
jgi:hypothetical protein